MSWIGKIFGTEKAIEKGMDTIDTIANGAIRGLDAAFYTKEEKAIDGIKIMAMRMDMVKSLQDENSARSLTRRILAIIILGNFFLHLNAYLVLRYFNVDLPVGEVLAAESTLVSIVGFFYFGYYGVKKILGK